MKNPFKGLELVGHLLPAIPLWIMGIVTILWGFHAMPEFGGRISNLVPGAGSRNDLIQLLTAIITGTIYAAIHISIVLTADSNKEFVDNIVHSNIGIALVIGGTLHWVFSRPHLPKLCINFGLPLIFISIGGAIGFHQDHTMINPNDPNGPMIDDWMMNMIHTMFGLSMITSGIMIAIGAVYRRWQVLEGVVHILSASLLTVYTSTFINPVRNNNIGLGNLITFCDWFSVAHALAIALYMHFSGKAAESACFFEAKHSEIEGVSDGK